MIWRHLMLALAEVESVPTYVLDRVGRLARGCAAQVELFNCLYDPALARDAPDGVSRERIRTRVDERRRRLERVADVLRDQNVEVRASVRWDFPMYEAIVRQVLRSGPSLLVVPAGRLGHAGPVMLTYTDARLIEACPCPLLLLKTEQVYGEGPVLAAVDPGHLHGKSAELDDTIVAAAKTLSYALSEAPVYLYHAVPSPDPAPTGAPDGLQGVAAPPQQQKMQWVGREHEARKLAARHDVPDRHVYVEVGAVETALPIYAREAHAIAVVMGAVSRAYPERAVFGMTAEKVLDALGCDALIVKPTGFRTPVARRTPAIRRPRGQTAAAHSAVSAR